MLGLKLNHVCKRGPWWRSADRFNSKWCLQISWCQIGDYGQPSCWLDCCCDTAWIIIIQIFHSHLIKLFKGGREVDNLFSFTAITRFMVKLKGWGKCSAMKALWFYRMVALLMWFTQYKHMRIHWMKRLQVKFKCTTHSNFLMKIDTLFDLVVIV